MSKGVAVSDITTEASKANAAIEKAAQKASERMDAPDAVKFDPATLLVIIQVILELAKLMQACKPTAKQAKQAMNDPGILGRLALRNAVSKHARGGFAYRNQVREAILSVASEATEEDARAIMAKA